MLTNYELERYTRQIALNGWGKHAQEKIKETTVFVAGAGGSGSPIITQLALLGIGKIIVCDYDTVSISNLNRQFIHCVSNESRIDINKAESAYKTIKNINPDVKVVVIKDKITSDNIESFANDSDIIFDCVDKMDVKFILSKYALKTNKPHLFCGMMDINSFACIFHPPQTPCFHCLYDYENVELINMKSSKEKIVVPVCCSPLFLSTGFIVMESIKILTKIGEPAYNQYFLFLQKGNESISESYGFLGMSFWITDFFRTISKDQGYDWDTGWNGKFVETLKIIKNKDCEYCRSIK